MAWDGDRHGVKSRLHDEGDDESGPSQGILAVKKSSHWTEETPKSTVLVRLDVRGSKMEEDKRREDKRGGGVRGGKFTESFNPPYLRRRSLIALLPVRVYTRDAGGSCSRCLSCWMIRNVARTRTRTRRDVK